MRYHSGNSCGILHMVYSEYVKKSNRKGDKKIMIKFTSRKFILSILSVISGMTGLIVSDNSLLNLAVNVVLIVIPTVVYTITEGKLDKEAIINTIDKIRYEIDENL